jgi:hypothetical protein
MGQDTVIHHLISEEEVLQKCIYCGKGLDTKEWKSGFYVRKHYKTVKCSCGKENKLTIKFEGSGHDDWLSKRMTTEKLEEKVK